MSISVHSTAIIDDGARIGEGSCVWHFVHVCSGAKIGAEDNADTRDQRKQAGAQKRNRDHRYQGTGLHDGGTDDAKTEAFRNRIGCTTQHALEKTTGKLAKPVLQREHAEQKNGNAGGNLFELWAHP